MSEKKAKYKWHKKSKNNTNLAFVYQLNNCTFAPRLLGLEYLIVKLK